MEVEEVENPSTAGTKSAQTGAIGSPLPFFGVAPPQGPRFFSKNDIIEAIIYLSHDLLEMIEPLIHHLSRGRNALLSGLRQHKVSIIMLCRITNPKNSFRGLLLFGRLWINVYNDLKIMVAQIIHRRIYKSSAMRRLYSTSMFVESRTLKLKGTVTTKYPVSWNCWNIYWKKSMVVKSNIVKFKCAKTTPVHSTLASYATHKCESDNWRTANGQISSTPQKGSWSRNETKAKTNWVRLGDDNTQFFPRSIKQRHRSNRITNLHINDEHISNPYSNSK